MPKFKRELIPGSYLTAADMLYVLGQQQLTAAALDSTIVLAAEPAMAWLLDRCCMGRLVPDRFSSSSSNISSVPGLVAAAAGVNRATPELQEQYEQYLVQLQTRRRRKARRMPGFDAAAVTSVAGMAAAAAAGGGEGAGGPAGPAMQPLPAVVALPSRVATAAGAAEQQLQQQEQEALMVSSSAASVGVGSCRSSTAAVTAAAAAATAEGIVAADGGSPGNGIALEDYEVPGAELTGDFLPTASDLQDRLGDGSGHCLSDGSGGLVQLQLVQLSCQEAFFMAHVLKCCSVFLAQRAPEQYRASMGVISDQQEQQQWLQQQKPQWPHQQQQQQQQQRRLSGLELWMWCCEHSPGDALTFVSRYAAYKHFRSKGWLPLPGVLYGADYVLYKLHPEIAHSDFVVTVLIERPAAAPAAWTLEGQAGSEEDGHSTGSSSMQGEPSQLASDRSNNNPTQLTWLDAHIMQRLARQVMKQYLLLFVVVPPGLYLRSAECMQQVQVKEVLLQRWVPFQHREDGREGKI